MFILSIGAQTMTQWWLSFWLNQGSGVGCIVSLEPFRKKKWSSRFPTRFDTNQPVSELVGNPKDQFSQVAAHILHKYMCINSITNKSEIENLGI